MPKVLRKRCSKCKSWKDTNSFNRNKKSSDGLNCWCRECHNASKRSTYDADDFYFKHILRRYGLTREAHRVLYEEQAGCCAICEVPESALPKRFHVDHCHSTGIVRGLLCHHCNVGLGHFDHDPKLLKSAIDYLKPRGLDTNATTALEHSN